MFDMIFFNMMSFIVPILVFTMFIFIIVTGIRQWQYNNSQPILIVSAKVVSRRTKVSTSTNNNSDGIGTHTSSSTSYYLTFEVEGGSRIEFMVRGNEYGLLVEGDTGKLKFQGTRYLGFDRSYDN